jgi:carboxyl-terminal processing protease
VRILLILLCLDLVLPLHAADTNLNPASDGRSTLAAELARSANAVKPAPGTNDGRIAYMTALMLEQVHYLHQKFDPKLSSRFLDRYLDTLDPQHIHFLQSDVAEFESFRDSLGTLTIKQLDTKPAYLIYNRFRQRLDERTAYASTLLNDGAFDFTANERVLLNRKEQPFPKDIGEARQLWRERLRYEYLQERLNKESNEEIGKLVVSRHNAIALGLAWQDFHNDIVNIIARRYGRIIRNFREWDNEKVLETYLTSLAHVYDPHSDFFDKADLENFSISMSLSLFGIGAVLSSEDGYCKIQELNPSGPAAKSKKVKANDRIVAVAQGDKEAVDVVDMPLNKVVELIRGPKGTEVRLTIIPASAVDPSTRTTVSLVRDQIKLEDQQAKARIIDLPDDKGRTHRLGVIDLPSFYASFPLMGSKDKAEIKSTTVDVARLLTKLKQEKVSGVILDLRRNGGGSLEEAINLTGLFIKQGPVVQIRDPNGEIQVDEDRDPTVEYDGPLIVLTSRFSASASEILAGALQDYGRALLVGDASTHGKGTVQSLNQLAPYIFRLSSAVDTNDPTAFGALKLTTRKFYRASGSSTQLKGVIPDIVLPSVDDHLESIGEAALENPLPWDTIETAKFEKLNRVQPYLPELEKRSMERVASAKDFDYVREDIEQVKKVVADKSISLNELQRLKEKDEADLRQKAREAELKARKQPDEKIYEITLKQVDLPGLPPALTRSNLLAAAAAKAHGPFQAAKPTPQTGQPGTKAAPSEETASVEDKNSAAIAESSSATLKSGDPDEAPEDEKAPAVDVNLIEAEHILTDYISLLPKEAALTANP